MEKSWISFSSTNLADILIGSEEFWRENFHGGWAALLVLVFILLWQFFIRRTFTQNLHLRRSVQSDIQSSYSSPTTTNSQSSISEIVSDVDLRNLVDDLEEKNEDEKWDNVVNKRNNLVTYDVKYCKPKDGPLKYLSVTVFENCSTEILRDFYMDNEYRKQWDKMIIEDDQLQIDENNGTEIGKTVKKFPFLTPREYVLAWRIWEGKDKTFYCYIKDCEHELVTRQKKYVRVGFFRSGWRIKKVPGRNACEIKMVHQEDAGLNVEMAKLAFAKGIWSYVCKMDAALRKYSSIHHPQSSFVKNAVTLLQKVISLGTISSWGLDSRRPSTDRWALPSWTNKFCVLLTTFTVPPGLETETGNQGLGASSSASNGSRQGKEVQQQKKLLRKPSKKVVANGLLLLGGIVCLSRGHSSIGAKIAIACILKKLTKHQNPSGEAVVPN